MQAAHSRNKSIDQKLCILDLDFQDPQTLLARTRSLHSTLQPNSDMTDITHATPLQITSSDELRFLPEGPFALSDGVFSWVAIQHGADAKHGSLNKYDLRSATNQSWKLPGRPGFAFPCQTEGLFLVGCERSLGFFNTHDQSWEPFCDGIDEGVDNTIINDGWFYEGHLIFGTKDLEFSTKKAGLYLYRFSDQKLIQLRDDQICSNGKAIIEESDGDLSLVDIDSPTRKIVKYPIDLVNGKLGKVETLLDLTDDPAVPDGAILSPDGQCVIVSMFLPELAEFGQTRMYDLKSGALTHTWQTPQSPQNTCPALVSLNDSLKLVITTAVENMSESDRKQCEHAGDLFLADTPFKDPSFRLTRFPR